jgi:hypothetical protein
MRGLGEVSQAVLTAARELSTPGSAPTLGELCAKARISRAAAMSTVKNLVRNGMLRIARTRKVDYRNKPVAEYELVKEPPPAKVELLDRVMTHWVQR